MTRRRVASSVRLGRRARALAVALLLAVAGCAGGSGSSGFDIAAENVAIELALAGQTCEPVEALTICAADGAGAIPGTPGPGMSPAMVETNLDRPDGQAPCSPADDRCRVEVQFSPSGFPPETFYAVAWREAAAPADWHLAPQPVGTGSPERPQFDASVEVPVDEAQVGAVQIAVLIFLADPGPLPDRVRSLAETGADFAFVSRELAVP